MIIGVSGRMGTGKDTFLNCLRYAACNTKSEDSWKKLLNEEYIVTHYDENTNPLVNKKFAYNLKLIVSILTGCNVTDLESQEFKNKLLPLEWNKTSVVRVYNGVRGINYPSDHTTKTTRLTYRELLQQVGTDLFRDQLHSNVWVNSFMSNYTPSEPITWVVTDVRFPNEADAILEAGGIVVRLERPSLTIPTTEHVSETALNGYKKFTETIIVPDGIDVFYPVVESFYNRNIKLFKKITKDEKPNGKFRF